MFLYSGIVFLSVWLVPLNLHNSTRNQVPKQNCEAPFLEGQLS